MQFHEPHPDVCFIHEKLITTWNYTFFYRESRALSAVLAMFSCSLDCCVFRAGSAWKLFPAARQAPFVSLKINYIFSPPFIMPCKPVRHGDNGAKSSGGLKDGCSSQRLNREAQQVHRIMSHLKQFALNFHHFLRVACVCAAKKNYGWNRPPSLYFLSNAIKWGVVRARAGLRRGRISSCSLSLLFEIFFLSLFNETRPFEY